MVRYQGGAVVSTLVRVYGIESRCLVWLVLSLLASRGSHVLPVDAVVLYGFTGDLALWGGHLEKASTIQQGWWGRMVLHACCGVPRGVVCVGGFR